MISCTSKLISNQIIIIAILVEKEMVGLSLQCFLGSKKRTSISRGNLGRCGVIRADADECTCVYFISHLASFSTSLFNCIVTRAIRTMG